MPDLEPEIHATLRLSAHPGVAPSPVMTMSRQICDLEVMRSDLRMLKWAVAGLLACNLAILVIVFCR